MVRAMLRPGEGESMKEPLWKTDVGEAARILLEKAKNTEVITINAGATIEHGFGAHGGRLCCDEHELIRTVCEFVDDKIKEVVE